MRGVLAAALLLGLGLAVSSCSVFSNHLMRDEQRLLVQNLMRDMEKKQEELEDSAKQQRWDAVIRVAEEMVTGARKLQEVRPRKHPQDFRIRSADLEHDLMLVVREARLGEGKVSLKTIDMHLDHLSFTCDSCHRKFQKGRPW